MVGWEVELYERNVELILTQDVAWYPVSGVTSHRPQVYHPMRLKEREVSVSGNPQTYVVFHEGRRTKGGWVLRPLDVEEVVSFPEERLGLEVCSITSVSRSCVRRVTRKVREMMSRGCNQRRVRGTLEGFSRVEWSIYLDMTVSDEKRLERLHWKDYEGGRGGFLDGGLHHCALREGGSEQVVKYESEKELTLLERADSDFALCACLVGLSLEIVVC